MSGRNITELQRTTLLVPRQTRLLIALGLWAIALVFVGLVTVPDLSRLLALASDTVEIEAIVYSHTDPSARINRQSVTQVNYRYERGGRVYVGHFWTIDEGELRRFRPGAPIPVMVALSDPSASRYTEAAGGKVSSLVILIDVLLFVLFMLGPAIYLVVAGRKLLQIRWLLHHGALAEAKVLTRTEVKGGGNFVRYFFEVDGSEHHGTVLVRWRKRMQKMVPHETLAVAYDPKNPERSCYFAHEPASSGAK